MAGLLITGAAVGAADELRGPGVPEAAAAGGFCGVLLLAALAGFLQADKPSTNNSGKSADRMSINEVMAFSLALGKNKRFLVMRLSAAVAASQCEAPDQLFMRQSRRP
jgi:hypothetical protein